MTEHLVIAFAACAGPAWASAMKTLPPNSFQHLGKLLQGMKRVQTHTGSAHSMSPPHERVLATALGLPGGGEAPDGLVPWAAREAHTMGMPPGKAWAFVTPCHWAMGREHATLTDPAGLALTADEAHTLHAAMQPYFGTEGITLHPTTPGRWLAEGEVFRTLPTASLDRVLGRNVDAWLPDKTTAGSLRRLQNEMQMLLYTHPLNDARSANRQRTVNSFWLSGSGALPGTVATLEAPTAPRTLAQAVFTDDWAAYAAAWAALDAGDIAQLLARQKAGETVRLTLCGDSHAQTFESAPIGWVQRLTNLFSPQPVQSLLDQL
ncbi:MAG: hypothetical protein ACKVOT_10030 [Polaromonas sp.]